MRLGTRSMVVGIALLSAAGCDPMLPFVPGPDQRSEPVNPSPMPKLPHPGGTGALAPWGGADASRWRNEAVLANAVSAALNAAWERPGVDDVTVAVPVRMVRSDFSPYGDGQTNATVDFPWWGQKRPPLVATRLKFGNGSFRIRLEFDRTLPLGAGVSVRGTYDGLWVPADTFNTFPLTREADGDYVAEFDPPMTVGWDGSGASVGFVQPTGWPDGFPVAFEHPRRTVDEFVQTVPEPMRRYSDGRDLIDPLGVSIASTGQAPFDTLSSTTFPGNYNQTPYTPDDIHGEFPEGGHHDVTAVGQGWTWVAGLPYAPMKTMYTCFERRRPELEATAPDGGTVSGSGWHRIGDPAETIVHSLEDEPIVVAYAKANALPGVLLPAGSKWAYGLTDVATFGFLRPGETFAVRRGESRRDGWGNVYDQSNYHWYFLHHGREICTEELIHPYRPATNGTFVKDFATIFFRSDWNEVVESGPIQAGSPIRVDYDTARLPSCRGPGWRVWGQYRVNGGQWRYLWFTYNYANAGHDGKMQTPYWVQVPEGAVKLEMYMINEDNTGCRVYDSNFGANYAFNIP